MKEADTFRIRAYGRMELASLYFPGTTPQHAWRSLRTWIDRMPGLRQNMGPMRRVFTPRQVALLIAAFGHP